ncbi:adenosylcobinamide-phosphate synthase CbiB [Devosia albogilva]|uniref:Cobalamin biosynthesis protein CobD n=1 Tax=Devosia albogilva TaxID=429726 RepID=A0ABW5QLK4_9HYPH
MDAFLAPLALAVERWLGYPPALLKVVGHPVMWFGRLITALETASFRRPRTADQKRLAGIVSVVLLVAAAVLPCLVIQWLLRSFPGGWLVEMLLATSFLAQKELGRAVAAVAAGLRQSLDAGRAAVSHVVGRDPQVLDEAGVVNAGVETLAESTSDGVVAPWFWLVLFGLPGIAAYKAINTADSMIGHRNERYRDYGWAAARLDDLVNLVPARFTALLVVIACFFVPQASPGGAWAAAWRDAMKHKSPNAGWPEAAFAGALGISLGGPRAYDGEVVDLPTMGDGTKALGPNHIEWALQLYRATLNVLLGFSVVLALALAIAG